MSREEAMGCKCGGKKRSSIMFVLSYGDGRQGGEFASKTDAEIADVKRGGGGTIRQVQR
ncbi:MULTISPECIES: hypothetical protein [Micromonospora]|uniref:hypothetical protein n=1 Tax=Micromonospora TaxID=1873 RepID=UPI001319FAC9|nr:MULTISPECIES: hypothetical protein [Micromonospora]NES14579.1 hypothetical protein [Micromonospora sp. PPF5-17B]NES35283.1 hypothetical protein [Micromonospora solifontis]